MELKNNITLDELIKLAQGFEEEEEDDYRPTTYRRFRASVYVHIRVPETDDIEADRTLAREALEEAIPDLGEDSTFADVDIYNAYIGGIKHDPEGALFEGELADKDW